MSETEARLGVRELIKPASFAEELSRIGKLARESISGRDISHLKKVDFFSRLLSVVGYATAWIFPNPVSAFLIAEGSVSRWCILSHHILHRAYDRAPGVPKRYTSKVFAKGWRRFIDWFDLIDPRAWELEHNVLHHAFTGESKDPDVAEDILDFLRSSELPQVFKDLILFFFMCTWKWTYYAPCTMREKLFQNEGGKKGKFAGLPRPRLGSMINPFTPWGWETWKLCYLPYFSLRFVAIPCVFLFIGIWPAVFVLINSVLAEVIANIHSFMVIVPNHTGNDIYRFESSPRSKEEFYLRQICGSVNYRTGTCMRDFMQGWLNYQIEHHLFSDLTLLKYREIQPDVAGLCKKYRVPYLQHRLTVRLKKMRDILTGRESMKMNRLDFAQVLQDNHFSFN